MIGYTCRFDCCQQAGDKQPKRQQGMLESSFARHVMQCPEHGTEAGKRALAEEASVTWPAPPVANMVTGATKRVRLAPASFSASTPRQTFVPWICSIRGHASMKVASNGASQPASQNLLAMRQIASRQGVGQ